MCFGHCLTVWIRQTSNSWSICLSLTSAQTPSRLHHAQHTQRSQKVKPKAGTVAVSFPSRCEHSLTCSWGRTASLPHTLRRTWTWDNLPPWSWATGGEERVIASPWSLVHSNRRAGGNSWNLGWGHRMNGFQRGHLYRANPITCASGI